MSPTPGQASHSGVVDQHIIDFTSLLLLLLLFLYVCFYLVIVVWVFLGGVILCSCFGGILLYCFLGGLFLIKNLKLGREGRAGDLEGLGEGEE